MMFEDEESQGYLTSALVDSTGLPDIGVGLRSSQNEKGDDLTTPAYSQAAYANP